REEVVLLALRERGGHVARAEPREHGLAGRVLDREVDAAPAPSAGARLLDHPAAEGLPGADLERGELARVRAVFVTKGQVPAEVAHGADVQAAEQLGALRADAAQVLDGGVERDRLGGSRRGGGLGRGR